MSLSRTLSAALFVLTLPLAGGGCHPSPQLLCRSAEGLGACNDPPKQASLEEIIVGELGSDKRKNLMRVDFSLASLQPGQGFVCRAFASGNNSAESQLSLRILPSSLGCWSPVNGEALNQRCNPPSGQTRASADLVLANNAIPLVQVGLVCAPAPMVAEAAVASVVPSTPASPLGKAGTPPETGRVTAHPAGGAGASPAGSKSGDKTSARGTPGSVARRVESGKAPQHSPLRPGGTSSPVATAGKPTTGPGAEAGTGTAVLPSKSTVAAPPAPSPSLRLGIDSVGEDWRNATVTLVNCDSELFKARAQGRFSCGALHGAFLVKDVDQCQIALTGGVRNEEDLKKLKGQIALRF